MTEHDDNLHDEVRSDRRTDVVHYMTAIGILALLLGAALLEGR